MFQRLYVAALLMALVAIACGGNSDSGDDAIRAGRTIYGDNCSVCHGSAGGGGVGPALDTVTVTWPECADHIEWIALGSDGWKETHGDTYGSPGKPVQGGMPAHAESLTLEQRRLVAAFERVQYGGADRESTIESCGIESAGTS